MGGGEEREGDRNRRARTCRVQMPHVSAALRPPTGTRARPSGGPRAGGPTARDVVLDMVLESRAGEEGQAREEPRAGDRAGETCARRGSRPLLTGGSAGTCTGQAGESSGSRAGLSGGRGQGEGRFGPNAAALAYRVPVPGAQSEPS